MKRLFYPLLSCIILSANSSAQWILQDSLPVTETLYDVFFINDSTGWIVGDSGLILHTTNSGTEWIRQNSGTDYPLYSVSFSDVYRGGIVGRKPVSTSASDVAGIILRTSDGGKSWHNSGYDTIGIPQSIFFTDAGHGWIVGYDCINELYRGFILRTSDGGTSWIDHDGHFMIPFHALYFHDSTKGWILGGDLSQSHIFKTTDGGTHWVENEIDTDYHPLLSICFADSVNGWAAGGRNDTGPPILQGGIIYVSNDGGETWTRQCEMGFQIRKIEFLNNNTGWAVGEYLTILGTRDGGVHWYSYDPGFEPLEAEQCLFSVFFIDSLRGWIVGSNGIIFKTTNGGALRIHDQEDGHLPEFTLEQNFPNPFNSTTTIRYALPASGKVSLIIYDLLGREVETLVDEVQSAGWKAVQWKSKNISSGIYFFALKACGFAATKKMILMR